MVKSADDLPAEWGRIDGRDHPETVVARAATAAERERCAAIADGYARNAEYRAAGHDNDDAKRAALDKMEAGLEIAARIRQCS